MQDIGVLQVSVSYADFWGLWEGEGRWIRRLFLARGLDIRNRRIVEDDYRKQLEEDMTYDGVENVNPTFCICRTILDITRMLKRILCMT